MAKPFQPLGAFASNITSQNGEDGILEELLRRIGVRNSWCLEVGAWDGEHLSNTCVLWRDKGWSAVLIECSDTSYDRLKQRTGSFSKVFPFHERVEAEGQSTLDAILRKASAPKDIDVVSIDVDGNDYYLLKSLREYKPRVIIIEHNPTIPPEVEVVQEPDSRARFGASAGSLVQLAREKGYQLAACTLCNCIFVLESEFAALGYPALDIRQVFPRDHVVYLMSCYNGKLFVSQPPLYANIKRSVSKWFRNWLWPDATTWPEKSLPVLCQHAVRGRD